MNRLEDSLLLWKSVVSNKLLEKVSIVLFLNKCDLLRVSYCLVQPALSPPSDASALLQAKLEAGVRLNHHMVSYGDRPNDYDSVSKCMYRLSPSVFYLLST